jgi:hypothetical protein
MFLVMKMVGHRGRRSMMVRHPVVSVRFWSRLDKDRLKSRFGPYKLHLETGPKARNRSIRTESWHF